MFSDNTLEDGARFYAIYFVEVFVTGDEGSHRVYGAIVPIRRTPDSLRSYSEDLYPYGSNYWRGIFTMVEIAEDSLYEIHTPRITYAFRSGDHGQYEILWFAVANPSALPATMDPPNWHDIIDMVEEQRDGLLSER